MGHDHWDNAEQEQWFSGLSDKILQYLIENAKLGNYNPPGKEKNKLNYVKYKVGGATGGWVHYLSGLNSICRNLT